MERRKIKPMDGYPIGYRFRPSEDDLFFHYLTKKVEGKSEAIPPFMPEVDIYGDDDPWEIFDTNSKESFYVFDRLKTIKSRVKRTAGSGTWSNGNKQKIMDDRCNIAGYNKLFTFKSSTGSKKTAKGHWTMHEYSMNGQELVLCVITNQDMAEKKSSDVITIGSTEERRRSKNIITVDDRISLRQLATASKASTSMPPVANLSLCDYPVQTNNVAHHQTLYVRPMPMPVVGSTPSNQIWNEPMHQPTTKIVYHDHPRTPDMKPLKEARLRSACLLLHQCKLLMLKTVILTTSAVKIIHHEITSEDKAVEVDVLPSSSRQASDARGDSHNDVGFYGSPLMAAVGASSPAQPFTAELELAPRDPYDELGKILRF